MTFHKIDKWTATAIVIANMVGTGVFTSLGFQLLDIQNAWVIGCLWLLGGLIALSGAFVYAEIGSFISKNGGEYIFLSELIHPSLGFIAGLVSVVVGFAAPIAAASVAFGKYLVYSFSFISQEYKELWSIIFAIIILILITCIHLLGIRIGGAFQRYVTFIKIFVMLFFMISFFYPNANPDAFNWNTKEIINSFFSSAFAVSLIYVSYAYSGWNAAAYVAGEIDNPKKNIAFSLITGTLLVMLFYVLLNMSFLYSTPVQYLKGKVEVGIISAQFIFGKAIGSVIGGIISILLISTISSMLIASPRVLSSMGEDYKILNFTSKKNKFQSPYMALLIISAISAILIISSSFEWLINFIGITLIIFTTLTSASIFLLRRKQNYQPIFKTPLFPLTPLFFISMNIWILIYVSIHQPSALLVSLGIMILGFVLYKFFNYNSIQQ